MTSTTDTNNGPVTMKDFLAWAESADLEDKVNPNYLEVVDYCYTSPEGNHCIVGQYLTDTGRPCPGWGDKANDDSVDILSTHSYVEFDNPVTVRLLTQIQNMADTGLLSTLNDSLNTSPTFKNPNRPTWAEVINQFREHEEGIRAAIPN